MRDVWAYFLGSPTPQTQRWRRGHALLLGLAGVVVLGLFWHFGQFVAWRLNNEPLKEKKNHDQTVFLEHASGYKNRGWDYFAPRQHMPGYGLLLVPFIRQGEDIWDFFWRAKGLSVVLSVVALAGLFGVWRRVFPSTEALLLTATAGLLLYVFRAGYFQPELIFFTLFLLCLILMLQYLDQPSWPRAIAVGGVFAATHLFKSSMLPSLALLGAGVAVRMILAAWKRDGRQALREAAMGAVIPTIFCLLLLPYLLTSQREFGSPFYSAHTKYHMWCDTHDESRALAAIKVSRRIPQFNTAWLMDASRDFQKYRVIYDDWIRNGPPSPQRYARSHTWQDVRESMQQVWKRTSERIEDDYTPLLLVLKGLLAMAAAVVVLRPLEAWHCLRRHWLAVAAYALFLGGYLLSYLFYAKIGMGPRLFLTLALPVLFGLAVVIWRLGRDATATWGGWTVSLRKVANWALFAYLLIAAREALTEKIYDVVGGQ